ncbi:hypothetical protein JTB14_012586 [Gonioctena quinquepunctata]|nr:hypothetical protein JTB14_012586 [Gonioctena quinquepunctata]
MEVQERFHEDFDKAEIEKPTVLINAKPSYIFLINSKHSLRVCEMESDAQHGIPKAIDDKAEQTELTPIIALLHGVTFDDAARSCCVSRRRVGVGVHSKSRSGVAVARYRVTDSQLAMLSVFAMLNRHRHVVTVERMSRQSTIGPASIRALELLEILNEKFPNFYPKHTKEEDPWNILNLKTRFDCTKFKKGETSDKTFHATCYGIISDYSEYQAIYTDGSTTPNRVGCAFFAENESLGVAGHLSSDSQSVLDTLQNNFTPDPLAK